MRGSASENAREGAEDGGSTVYGEPLRDGLAAAGYAGFRGPVIDARSLVQEPSESPGFGTACGPTEGDKDGSGINGLVERLMSVDVTEVYSPPRVTLEAKKFGLKSGEAWDLTTGWDSTKKEHRDAAVKY